MHCSKDDRAKENACISSKLFGLPQLDIWRRAAKVIDATALHKAIKVRWQNELGRNYPRPLCGTLEAFKVSHSSGMMGERDMLRELFGLGKVDEEVDLRVLPG